MKVDGLGLQSHKYKQQKRYAAYSICTTKNYWRTHTHFTATWTTAQIYTSLHREEASYRITAQHYVTTPSVWCHRKGKVTQHKGQGKSTSWLNIARVEHTGCSSISYRTEQNSTVILLLTIHQDIQVTSASDTSYLRNTYMVMQGIKISK